MIVRRAALALVLLAMSGCAGDPLAVTLPPELMVRSDAPYVRGRIVAREAGPPLRVAVRARAGSDARVPEAIVTVADGTRLLWPDGAEAPADDLRIGRAVMVWATGAELRSQPPQVTAAVVLLGR